MPSVSVVIPAHRLDRWLDEAVESALASEDVDLEVVVALDGIGAASPRWGTDPRVRILFHEDRRGAVATSQAALDAATAPFVARMDSDDVCLPDRLAIQSRYLVDHPDTVAVYSAIELIDENGTPVGTVDSVTGPDVRMELLLYNFLPHPTLMLRREVAEAVGGYDQRVEVMEDYILSLSLGRHGKVAKVDQRLLQYRVHSGQTSKAMLPYGPHIDAVLEARRRLARVLGVGRLTTWARNTAWVGVRWWRRIVGGSQMARVRRVG